MLKSNSVLLKIIPPWITPNAISVLRLALIPAIVIYMALGFFKSALVVFIIAALLDAIDGALARARNQISDWGLILDPLADKMLVICVISFLLLLYPFKPLILSALVFDLLILAVAAFKLGKFKSGSTLPIKASNYWGKGKMLAQVVGISLALLWLAWPIAPLLYLSGLIIWLSLALQIGSAITYS